MPVPPSGAAGSTPSELAQTLRDLQAELAAERQRRMAAERVAGARRTVEAALLVAERDRDTLTSDVVQALRERAASLADRLVRVYTEADYLRVLYRRLSAASVIAAAGDAGDRLAALLRDEAQARTQAIAALTKAGVEWFTVPAPIDPTTTAGVVDGPR